MIPKVNMTALGANLASTRRQQHLRQADLAREVGIHEVTLSRIENGKLPGVTVAVLARLAMRLDMSVDHLLQWQPGQHRSQGLDLTPVDQGVAAETGHDGVLGGLKASWTSKRKHIMALPRPAQKEQDCGTHLSRHRLYQAMQTKRTHGQGPLADGAGTA